MHGLVNRSIQCFLRDTYGEQTWLDIALAAKLGFSNFEALMPYDDALTLGVIDAATEKLSKPRAEVLEDLGTYLATHENLEPIRRLLRFEGDTFVDFRHSLDDLQDRTLLALPDLLVPALEIREHSFGNFTISSKYEFPAHGHVIVGILRAMADDYGSLAVLEHMGRTGGEETIFVQMLETQFSQGRDFDLAQGIQAHE
jgi:hypothetical protein